VGDARRSQIMAVRRPGSFGPRFQTPVLKDEGDEGDDDYESDRASE